MRSGVDFELVDDETGKRMGGIQSCQIDFDVSMWAPVITLQVVVKDLDIDLKKLVLRSEEVKPEKVTIKEEFANFES